jgi:hypothetical protein
MWECDSKNPDRLAALAEQLQLLGPATDNHGK